MIPDVSHYDVAVIGAGFYGASIALKFENEGKKVILIEREEEILSRASKWNQARVHNGYHYPRSFSTAYRSRINYQKFLQKYNYCIESVEKIYGISKNNSKINAKQFETLCHRIGAKLMKAPSKIKKLFNLNYIESVYIAEEQVFNAEKLKKALQDEINDSNIKLLLGHSVSNLEVLGNEIKIGFDNSDIEIKPKKVFNCTYSGLNSFKNSMIQTELKHEITEMALVTVPAEIKNLGVTIMDGPFFSLMPFPIKKLHTLSHVRYTPHLSLDREKNIYKILDDYSKISEYKKMKLDVKKYMPILEGMEYRESIYEIKTVLKKNESNDGRPILFERNNVNENIISVLGGKIDNIFDIVEKIDNYE